jgi:hypothetical protein
VSAVRRPLTFSSNERPERGLRARGARGYSFFYPSLSLYIFFLTRRRESNRVHRVHGPRPADVQSIPLRARSQAANLPVWPAIGAEQTNPFQQKSKVLPHRFLGE